MLLGFFLGGWEVALLLAVLLILFGAKHLPPLAKSLGRGIDEFLRATDRVTSQLRDLSGHKRRVAVETEPFSVRLLVARGLGIGLIPAAPGTFGSLLGLVWFAMLVATGNFWAYLAGAIEGIAFSLWLCDDAEKILGETDPPSVVLDEIVAIPFCFLPWVAVNWWRDGVLPSVSFFFTGRALWLSIGVIVLFRVFDIWKPWPVRQSQRLPGGWGITVDDLLAAVYVALISIPFVLKAL